MRLMTVMAAMDFFLSSQPIGFVAISALLIFLFSFLLISRNATKKKAAPKAGGAWPVIGHLNLLGGPEPPHRVLADMADKYGPLFMINMGVHRALVVGSWEIAKECLTTNDRVFANRPKTLAMEILGYNFSMPGFAPYGPYWRQARKIVTLELLSNHRLEKLKHVRESELKTSLKELYELWLLNRSSRSNKLLVEMKRWFGDITLNVILRIVVGKRCTCQEGTAEIGDTWKEELTRFFEWSGKFVVSDALPFLRWLDIGGDARLMKKTAKELDIIAQEWYEEHKRKRVSNQVKADEDFMDVMISILENPELFPGRDADTVNKATCLGSNLVKPSSFTQPKVYLWNNLLRLKVNPRIKLFIWKAVNNGLPVLANLFRRKISIDPQCPVCSFHEETMEHALFHYHHSKATWFRGLLSYYPNIVGFENFGLW